MNVKELTIEELENKSEMSTLKGMQSLTIVTFIINL
jgi:hypothetical protein